MVNERNTNNTKQYPEHWTYNYSMAPKNYQPFKKVKFFQEKINEINPVISTFI